MSAVSLSDKDVARLKEKLESLTGKTVDLTVAVDPAAWAASAWKWKACALTAPWKAAWSGCGTIWRISYCKGVRACN